MFASQVKTYLICGQISMVQPVMRWLLTVSGILQKQIVRPLWLVGSILSSGVSQNDTQSLKYQQL